MTKPRLTTGGDFSPRSIYDQLVRRWWWAGLCVILGAAMGWGLSRLNPPLYEARSTFAFNIDYSQTGLLTDVQEDQALEAAGDLLRSTEVRTQALESLSARGIRLAEVDLKESFTVERRNNAWLVIARRADPAEAEAIAAAWGESFDQIYSEAYLHAAAADSLLRYSKSLETCLQEAAAVEPVQAGCQVNDLKALQEEIARSGQALLQERKLGRNLFSGMLYEWSGRAELSPAPVRFESGRLILFGGLAGLVFSLWLIQARPLGFHPEPGPTGAN